MVADLVREQTRSAALQIERGGGSQLAWFVRVWTWSAVQHGAHSGHGYQSTSETRAIQVRIQSYVDHEY